MSGFELEYFWHVPPPKKARAHLFIYSLINSCIPTFAHCLHIVLNSIHCKVDMSEDAKSTF